MSHKIKFIPRNSRETNNDNNIVSTHTHILNNDKKVNQASTLFMSWITEKYCDESKDKKRLHKSDYDESANLYASPAPGRKCCYAVVTDFDIN